MDLEIVGRHALLFDDDAMAAFVNSSEALVEWNSLDIDRYDVRHLLPGPLPPRPKRRPVHHPDESLEADLNIERYLDLPSSSDEHDQGNVILGFFFSLLPFFIHLCLNILYIYGTFSQCFSVWFFR